MTKLRCSVLLVAGLLVSPVAAQRPLRRIGINAREGLSAAVVVEDSTLVHTSQLLPKRAAGASKAEQLTQVLNRLDEVLAANKLPRGRVVKLNVYVADAATRDFVKQELVGWFGRDSLPAVSYVATSLPRGAKVALDAVLASNPKHAGDLPTYGFLNGSKTHADWSVAPLGDVVYVSGQAEQGGLAKATRATLDSLLRTIRHMKLQRKQILELKCFMQPIDQVAIVDGEIKRFFGDAVVPPVSHVEWISGSRSIEIELVVFAPPQDTTETVTYSAPPWLKTSPVYSRVARIHGDHRIYVSGLYSEHGGDGAAQVRDIFRSLEQTLTAARSDLKHLAKATYYVSNDDTSAQLNAIRPSIYDPKRPPAASKAKVRDVAAADRGITIDMIAAPGEGR